MDDMHASMIQVQDGIYEAFPEKKLIGFSFREEEEQDGVITIVAKMKDRKMGNFKLAKIKNRDNKKREKEKREKIAKETEIRHPIKIKLKISRENTRTGDDKIRVLSKIFNVDGIVQETVFVNEENGTEVRNGQQMEMIKATRGSSPIEPEPKETWDSTPDTLQSPISLEQNEFGEMPRLMPFYADASFGQE